MKPPDRVNQRVTFRSGLIAFSAIACLALSFACEQHAGVAASAPNADGVSPSTATAADTTGAAIRPFRVEVPDADLADLKRRLVATCWPDKKRPLPIIRARRAARKAPGPRALLGHRL